MAQAKYSLMIPKVDNLGNPLRNVAEAAHHFLYYGPLQVEGSYIDPNKVGQWRDDGPEPHDILVTYAEDNPMMDSQMKALAVEVGEACNQWGIFVTKEGAKGVFTWTISNPRYRPGEPALPVALEQPSIDPDTGTAFPPQQPPPM